MDADRPRRAEAAIRVLVPSSSVGALLGKGGAVIQQLRDETGAWIKVLDQVYGCPDRVVLMSSDEMPRVLMVLRRVLGINGLATMTSADDEVGGAAGRSEAPSGAPGPSIHHDKAMKRASGLEPDEAPTLGRVRLLVSKFHVGCVLGPGGMIVGGLRRRTGARILVVDVAQVPGCANVDDESIHISGGPAQVGEAVELVAKLLMENQLDMALGFAEMEQSSKDGDEPGAQGGRRDAESSGGGTGRARTRRASVRRSMPKAYAASNLAGQGTGALQISTLVEQLRAMCPPGGNIFRLLIPQRLVGAVIGHAGARLNEIRERTSARISISNHVPGCEERVAHFYESEPSDTIDDSPAISALLEVHDIVVSAMEQSVLNELLKREESDRGMPPRLPGLLHGVAKVPTRMTLARLLVPKQQIGALLGFEGRVITKIKDRTGVAVRVLPEKLLPACGLAGVDELVQVKGSPGSVRTALGEMLGRIRQKKIDFLSALPGSSGRKSSSRPMQDVGDVHSASATLYIQSSALGALFGRGGVNISNIRKATGALIQVQDRSDANRIRAVELVGSIQGVSMAVSSIEELVGAHNIQRFPQTLAAWNGQGARDWVDESSFEPGHGFISDGDLAFPKPYM